MKVRAFRLVPGQDLTGALQAFVESERIEAACVVTCVGSLERAVLRLASGDQVVTLEGPFEIVSLVGTLSLQGCHLHVALADETGTTLGGHVKEGCVVHTTAEVVLGLLPGLRFRREPCPLSGWDELVIERKDS